METPFINPYKDLDLSDLCEPTHKTPLLCWSQEIQEDVFQSMYKSGVDVINVSHRLIGLVSFLGKIMVLISLAVCIAALGFMMVSEQGAGLFSGMTVALGVLGLLAGGGFLWHIQSATEQDYKGISELANKIRIKNGEWIDWEGPYKYEYSTALWFLRRLEINESRTKREALMGMVDESERAETADQKKPMI